LNFFHLSEGESIWSNPLEMSIFQPEDDI
jgi:hypothetical protein